jgi:hypothetical protein
MKQKFGTECCYWAILSTRGIDHVDKFKSAKEYEEYYGYDFDDEE